MIRMEDTLNIRVNIVDRYYPLTIRRKDEERIRKAARMINDAILQYKQKYSEKDNQDFLSMAALHYVTGYLELQEKNDVTPLVEKIRDVDAELTDFIASQSYTGSFK